MEDFKQCELEFEDFKLSVLVDNLNNIFKKRQNNFAELCTCVAKIYYYCKEHSYKAKNDEYYNATKLLGKFGFEERQYQRIVKCYEKFMTDDLNNDAGVGNLKSVFFHFSSSKLFELLSVSNEQLLSDIDKKILYPEMTKQEIRQYVKDLRGGEKEGNKVLKESSVEDEEDLEDLEFYNPDNHYDVEFFESCTKEQLVAIVARLQFEYEKLKKKK